MNQLLLVEAGQPRSHIVLPSTASSTERHAALELQSHLQQISGAHLPIVEQPSGEASIYLGRTPQVEALLNDPDWNAIGEDGCIVRTIGHDLVLAGATPRGTLYAVYEFLDEVLGCRWLSAAVSHIPNQPTIAINTVDIVHTPPFRYRETFFSIAEDADWAARNRTNGAHARLGEEHGGKWTYAGFVHTFYELVPPERYFDSHPEYYSELEGERTAIGGQLCLTNPELIGVVADAARRRMQEHPDARILSISQNDHYGNCQCANCREMDEAEGSPSGAMVRFVNAVAELLEAEYPQVYFDTLAYTYTVAPPRHARPRHNVIIRLCNISPVCDGHPLEQCEINRPFVEYLKGWGEISPEVFIWDYYTNFLHYFMPFPNFDALCADVPLFARSGVTGLFCQADGAPTKGCGEFAELRSYVLAKLMWRPERDGRQIIDEFLRLYYGEAAEHIRAYIDLIHAPVRDGRAHFDLYCSLDQPFLTPEVMTGAEAIFEQASKSVAGNAELEERVATARLPIEYIQLRQNAKFVVQRDRLAPADPDIIAVAEKFAALAAKHGARAMREGGRPLASEVTVLRGYDLVTLEAGGLKLVIGPAIGGRLMSLTDLVTGEEWLYNPLIHAVEYPFAGGYEEYTEDRWHSPGWTETYTCEISPHAAHLTVSLPNDMRIERTYRVEPGETPALVIESTHTNIGKVTRPTVLRSHPELAAMDMKNCHVRLMTANGTWQELPTWPVEGRATGLESGSLWLRDEEMPAGKWALVRGKRALTIEYDTVKIGKCLLDWRAADAAITMELFGHPQQLEPGASFVLTQRWTMESAE